jgi:hypothetical protein
MLRLSCRKRRPVAVAISTLQSVSNVGLAGRVWKTDVKLFRKGEKSRVFTDILFVEGAGLVYIAGLEFENIRAKGLDEASALRQHEFIDFLHNESSLDNKALGFFGRIFQGYEYGCVGRVTAAFIAALGEPLNMGIGFWNEEGGYALFAIDPNDGGFLETAKRALPFDELGD